MLPISNPANLVVFGRHMPPLAAGSTFLGCPRRRHRGDLLVLRATQRRALIPRREIPGMRRFRSGGTRALGLVLAAVVLILASALGRSLGLPTFVAAAAMTVVILLSDRSAADSGRGIPGPCCRWWRDFSSWSRG